MYGSKVTYYEDKHISLYNPLVTSGEILKHGFLMSITRLLVLSLASLC